MKPIKIPPKYNLKTAMHRPFVRIDFKPNELPYGFVKEEKK